MSSRLRAMRPERERQIPEIGFLLPRRGSLANGFGMLEFLIALLLFSTGLLGLLSAQMAGKRAIHDAAQRSVATVLASDILARIRSNSGQVNAYQAQDIGDTSRRLAEPVADCEATDCTPLQLSEFDLWQWESQLLGESAYAGVTAVGGLVAPLACIGVADGTVRVTVTWLGMSGPNGPLVAGCNDAGAVLEDGGDGAGDSLRQRHQLTAVTFVAGR